MFFFVDCLVNFLYFRTQDFVSKIHYLPQILNYLEKKIWTRTQGFQHYPQLMLLMIIAHTFQWSGQCQRHSCKQLNTIRCWDICMFIFSNHTCIKVLLINVMTFCGLSQYSGSLIWKGRWHHNVNILVKFF